MNKEMIISSNGHETRVAILEDDQVAEIFIEREQNRGVVGNVYKGRVSKVLPGMQSAFVDLGLERDGFLYVSDVIANLDEFDKDDDDDDEAPKVPRVPTVPTGRRRQRRCRRGIAAPPERRGRGRDRAIATTRSGARAEDRRAAEGRAGRHRPGGQGAARHEGRAPDLARDPARPLPGVHADRRSHRRLAQDRQPRRARAPARHRPRVPRAARLHRRRDHPHRRVGPIEGRHRRRPELLPPGLGRHAAARRAAAPPVGLPGAEPRRQAAARPADRRLLGDPHRQPGRAPARARVHRPHHAGPRQPA